MKEHGTTQAALAALPEVAKAAGVEKYEVCPEGVARAELRAAQQVGARMICLGDPLYPSDLAEISDAPPILWAIGDTEILQRPLVAIVGARNASSLGQRMAKGLAADLAGKGFAVVSGMARGVDTAAHTATLDTGTIAVLAGGVDVMYPAENARLAEDIAKTGVRLSEQPMGMVPQARHFPRRNRIISGLCRATIVVEAAAKSGSLITARTALDQGREVLAVPGHPFDARAAGCNMLIRDGASLVRNAEDVIDVIGAVPVETTAHDPEKQAEMQLAPEPRPAPPKRSLQDTAALHRQILDRLGPSPLAEDQLIRDLKAPASNISPVLTDLELDGRIRRHAGGLLSLAVPKAG